MPRLPPMHVLVVRVRAGHIAWLRAQAALHRLSIGELVREAVSALRDGEEPSRAPKEPSE